MSFNSISQDPAFPAMTMDILDNMLSRSDNPGQLARYMTEEIRELTGARCVLLFQCLSHSHRIIEINPERNRKWAESNDMTPLFQAAHELTGTCLWQTDENLEISTLLHDNGFDISIAAPLQVGDTRIGAMLLLGLPDKLHIETEIILVSTLSKILALMLRNALIYENQEKIIEDRAKELMLYGVTMDTMKDAVFWINHDSTFQKINASACTMLEYSSEELSGLRLEDIIPEFTPDKWNKHWENLKQSGAIDLETSIISKNGREIPVDVSANYFEFEGNAYNCAIVRDITERRRTEETKLKLERNLRQSQKMESIGTFAGGIAHDFNNILSPIIGYTEMLKEDAPHGSDTEEFCISILNAALIAKDLVNQILTFSRQRDQEFKPVRVQSILKEALKLLKASIPSTIDIITDIDSDCGEIVADPIQIHQIIMNLATNAYQAMKESGGTLKITLDQVDIESSPLSFSDLIPGSYAFLKVTDTGTGIPKNVMDKIFDPYFTTKETGKGTGLGLSVVEGIVKSSSGAIHLYSEPGKGTEVHIYLPISKKQHVIENYNLAAKIQGGNERILVVDDEEMIATMEKLMLERMGYQVVSFSSSNEALKAFGSDPDCFDLVISDMTMPYMTGLQLASRVKALRADIPVIICSGFSDQINKDTIRNQCIEGYVMKPVSRKELSETIRQVLTKKKSAD
jgi:PAS domain S-box-containing protein